MTDEALRDLVLRHDASIVQLVSSIEHLTNVQSNMSVEIKESNAQIKELMSYLASQQVHNSKLETMDKELHESFARVHKRIDELSIVQNGSEGCKVTQLQAKDIGHLQKEQTRLVGDCEEHRIQLENLDKSKVSIKSLQWLIAMLLGYGITFGTYVVQSISGLEASNLRVLTIIERNHK